MHIVIVKLVELNILCLGLLKYDNIIPVLSCMSIHVDIRNLS